MKTIHKLSNSQIAKIAAGEVIEKPSFAVKELIENSIDAGSTHIQVFLEEGGLKKIQIIDDGAGMSEEDLKECFKLHTTSKIPADDDLAAIRSMGFRGEALASIASISRMNIQSRQQNSSSGTKIVLEAGKIISSTPVGMPKGTQIEVFDLFYSVPGRKKFSENPQKEYRHVLDWVIRLALGNPSIRFTLTNNNKQVFDVAKNQTLLERTQFFLKEDLSLLPIKFEDSYINITGFTSPVNFSTSSTSKQFIFVNNRPITDKLISVAIKETYGVRIEHNKYPVYILNISIPPEMVDVNVHPRKEQINLLNRQLVFDQVQKAIYQTLQINNPFSGDLSNKSITKSFAGQLLKQNVELFNPQKKFDTSQNFSQFFDLYIIFQAQNQLILVDQHAAHERILYEQFKNQFEDAKTKKIKLQKPIKLDFSLTETEILSQTQKTFQKLGFSIDTKKQQVSEIPAIFQDRDIKQILTEIIEQILLDKKITLDQASDQMLKYLACRAAIKQGDKLSNQQMKDLVKKLFITPNYTYCPHGRPTHILHSINELNKQFKRI